MGNLLILSMIVILSGLAGVVAYFLLFKRFAKRPEVSAGLFTIASASFLAWFVFFFIPDFNSRQRIVQYAGEEYGISYSDIRIIERSPGEGELLTFSDNQAGAIAFYLDQSKKLELSTPCDKYSFSYVSHYLKETFSSDDLDLSEWRCVSHNKNKFDSYTLFENQTTGVYVLTFSWSFG